MTARTEFATVYERNASAAFKAALPHIVALELHHPRAGALLRRFITSGGTDSDAEAELIRLSELDVVVADIGAAAANTFAETFRALWRPN